MSTVPVLWLIGKTQSGKTSIAAEFTGGGSEGIGEGFHRMTGEPRLYPWPPEPAPPVLHFLDTPGLFAPGANAVEEAELGMRQGEDQAHLLLVVLRAEDIDLAPLHTVLKAVRARHREWPVIVAQTRLHDLYPPCMDHPMPHPYGPGWEDAPNPQVPITLVNALAAQREAFRGLPGPAPVFVPVDFTRTNAGLTPRNYGAEALLERVEALYPELIATVRPMRDPLQGARLRILLPWALAAAAAEAPPLPGIGIIGSAGAQGLMLSAIAASCGIPWNWDLLSRFAATLGPGILTRSGAAVAVSQFAKLLPGPGTAYVAATTFVSTWAIGEAAMVMFAALGRGEEPNPEEVGASYRRGFDEAKRWYSDFKNKVSP